MWIYVYVHHRKLLLTAKLSQSEEIKSKKFTKDFSVQKIFNMIKPNIVIPKTGIISLQK